MTTSTRQFIVCSHITSQRAAALERLEQARARTTVGALRDRIVREYGSRGFARHITDKNVDFLVDTAATMAGATAAADDDDTLADSKPFWSWLNKALKLLVILQPYWDSGAIAGFVSRTDAIALLADKHDGTW